MRNAFRPGSPRDDDRDLFVGHQSAVVGAAATRDGSRRFGTPSSFTWVMMVSGSPVLIVRALISSTLSVGGVFARTSGLLVPAPSAPVSDAFTTSSRM